MPIYLTAQTIAEKSKQSSSDWLQVMVYNSLSSFYSTIEDYDRAIDYQYKSLDYAKKLHNATDILNGLNTIGSNYIVAKKYINANPTIIKATCLNKYTSLLPLFIL